jgi:hypothetical protein
MNAIHNLWNYVFAEPFTWIREAFFQPARMRQEFERAELLQRVKVMLRLAFPLLLSVYLFTLLVEILLIFVLAKIDGFDFQLAISSSGPIFARNTLGGTVLGIILALIMGIGIDSIEGIVLGCLWGTILGLMTGMNPPVEYPLLFIQIVITKSFQSGFLTVLHAGPEGSLLGGLVGALVSGSVGIIAGFLTKDIKGNLVRCTVWGLITGFIIGAIANAKPIMLISFLIAALIAGLAGAITKSLAEKSKWGETVIASLVGSVIGPLVEITRNAGLEGVGNSLFQGTFLLDIGISMIIGCVSGLVLGATFLAFESSNKNFVKIVISILLFLLLEIYYQYYYIYFNNFDNFNLFNGSYYQDFNNYSYSIYYIYNRYNYTNNFYYSYYYYVIPIAFILFFTGILISISKMSKIINMINITLSSLLLYFISIHFTNVNSTFDLLQALIASTTFAVGYVFGTYRLPLYPLSSASMLKTYVMCRNNPPRVFDYLCRSSLHWDECVYFPLPGLKQVLLYAADQDTEKTLEEVDFILYERPRQVAAARAVMLEIAMRDIEMCETLLDIAQFSSRFTTIFPSDVHLIDSRWITPFVRINSASRDAARFCSPLGWGVRHRALEEMIANLKRVHARTAFEDQALNVRLSKMVDKWLQLARTTLSEAEDAFGLYLEIGNPYNPGDVLELNDSLFKGRRDLAQQLSEALSRGNHRPTFLLYGERRMGKSSTIKQLPDLLGGKYLTIFFDMQNRGNSSSIVTLLGTIAEQIRLVMQMNGIKILELPYERLKNANRENEATTYYVFDRWLRDIEQKLVHENLTLLLAFDEFEKLEEAGQASYLNLHLLLDWFRTIIQHHRQLALLFSGTHTFSEMESNWAAYFVSVQTLKVSFLHSDEAYQLITQPVLGFPYETVFGSGVVSEIINQTNGHPFLIQAVCSALINWLNNKKKEQAELQDVKVAIDHMLNNWRDTYFLDLWIRTGEEQRTCLTALNNLKIGDETAIENSTALSKRVVRRNLETLLNRDLIVCTDGIYRIAAPIFSHWIEQNIYR